MKLVPGDRVIDMAVLGYEGLPYIQDNKVGIRDEEDSTEPEGAELPLASHCGTRYSSKRYY